ncbi:MAG: adenylate kinase [Candidatus Micrarchaeota archaeon]|nr:adenylate kinase [Candidatus Micrarchaeota archaeon]
MIIVLGTPGAGKTTVLNEAVKENPACKVINYGDIMIDLAIKDNLAKDRDQLRKLGIAQQKRIQMLAAQMLSEEQGDIILNTHAIVSTPNGTIAGLPFDFLSRLKVDGLIMITAPTADILRRRREDQTRVRDAQSEEELDEIRRINMSFLHIYAALTGAPVELVYNRDGKLEEAVNRVRELMNAWWRK